MIINARDREIAILFKRSQAHVHKIFNLKGYTEEDYYTLYFQILKILEKRTGP